ncbi:hypothetical protein ACVWZR_008314 [Bradyrhizobium sp. i1.3.1]
MRIAERVVFRAATMKNGVRDHRIGEDDRDVRKQLAEHAADAFDIAGNDRIAELAQAAEAGNGDADLRKRDAAAARPVAQ